MARKDAARQIHQRRDLRLRKRLIAKFMAGIDQLDADGARVDVGLARPPRQPGMPGAQRLRHMGIHTSIAPDGVMR